MSKKHSKNAERIKIFKESQDYIDISYFIKHVNDINYRKSLLEELGYKIGVEFPRKTKTDENSIYIGKKNDLRFQISKRLPSTNLAWSIILDNY